LLVRRDLAALEGRLLRRLLHLRGLLLNLVVHVIHALRLALLLNNQLLKFVDVLLVELYFPLHVLQIGCDALLLTVTPSD
jgi:hypothetical protein